MTRSPTPVASRSVVQHLLRGAAGLLAAVGGLLLLHGGGPVGIVGALSPLALALFLFRGCPMCWIVGLIERVTPHTATQTKLLESFGKGDPS